MVNSNAQGTHVIIHVQLHAVLKKIFLHVIELFTALRNSYILGIRVQFLLLP